jgi:hypothetical protein
VVEFSDQQWIAAANAVKPGSAHCVMCVERIKVQLRQGIATKPIHDPSCVCDGACDGGCGKSCCGTAVASKPSKGSSCCAKGGDEKKPSWPGPSISALSCKGLKQLLAMAMPPTPPVRVVTLVLPELMPFVPEWPEDAAYSSRSLDAPEPPPRA